MDEDDAAAALGTPTPTVFTADAVGAKVPRKEDKPIDQFTGLPKEITIPLEGVIEEKPEPTKEEIQQ
jgi:hypothetical protein